MVTKRIEDLQRSLKLHVKKKEMTQKHQQHFTATFNGLPFKEVYINGSATKEHDEQKKPIQKHFVVSI